MIYHHYILNHQYRILFVRNLSKIHPEVFFGQFQYNSKDVYLLKHNIFLSKFLVFHQVFLTILGTCQVTLWSVS